MSRDKVMHRMPLATAAFFAGVLGALPVAAADLCSEHLATGKYLEAVKACSAQIRSCKAKDCGLADLYLKRAQAYDGDHDWRKALKDYDKVISLDQSLALAYMGRGRIYCSDAQGVKGIRDLDRAITLDPTLRQAYVFRGKAYSWLYHQLKLTLQEGQARAVAEYSKAIEMQPDDAALILARGELYRELKDWDHMIEDYTAWLKFNTQLEADQEQDKIFSKDLIGVYRGRGWAYQNKGDLVNAQKDFDRAYDLDEDGGW